jgi:hypothetical protein
MTLLRFGIALCASSAAMGQVSAIDGMKEIPRYFNDRPGSNLVFENVYPALFRISEDKPGPGGFANGHMGAFSVDGGANAYDFNYGDAFDTVMTMNVLVDPINVGGEAGFKFNLFGIGHFGVLPHNGEIAAFGGILPFHTFGAGLWSGGDIDLRIIHTPGNGNGLPGGATIPSTMEYMYNLGSGWISSGPIAFSNLEGGIPDIAGNPLYLGPGIQNNWGAGLIKSDVNFTNIKIVVPAPGALAVGAGLGLLAMRRRR